MPELPTTPLGWFDFIAVKIVVLCTAAVLAAVAWNFLCARFSGQVAERRRSPVATGTMLLFTFGVYWLISRRIGALPRPEPTIDVPLVYLGLALMMVGCIVNLLGRLHLGRNWANQVTVYEDQTLVTGGVFGVVRHPLYASLIWMFVGASLVYLNYAALLATVCIFIPAMYYRAKQEETLLAAQFPEYEAYRKRVGMFFPKLMKNKNCKMQNELPSEDTVGR